jgi:hypothetical protein
MPAMLKLRSRTKTNPLFYPERLARLLAHDPERVRIAREDEESVDLLTWNVFASLDTDRDREYLAGQLRAFCGNDLVAPVRLSLWTGRDLEPRVEPSSAYVRHIRETVGGDEAQLAEFTAPIEVPVRIESPTVLGLVDTLYATSKRGAGGRDRIVELIDAGLVQADRLGVPLAVAVVYRSGTPAAAEVSRRLNELRQPGALAAALPWRERLPEVRLREVSWQQLATIWEHERGDLQLGGQPVRGFRDHLQRLGIRGG